MKWGGRGKGKGGGGMSSGDVEMWSSGFVFGEGGKEGRLIHLSIHLPISPQHRRAFFRGCVHVLGYLPTLSSV